MYYREYNSNYFGGYDLGLSSREKWDTNNQVDQIKKELSNPEFKLKVALSLWYDLIV